MATAGWHRPDAVIRGLTLLLARRKISARQAAAAALVTVNELPCNAKPWLLHQFVIAPVIAPDLSRLPHVRSMEARSVQQQNRYGAVGRGGLLALLGSGCSTLLHRHIRTSRPESFRSRPSLVKVAPSLVRVQLAYMYLM